MTAFNNLMGGLDKFFGMNQKPFYNTIELSPEELKEANSRAISQEDRIYNWMEDYSQEWTAWGLKKIFFQYEITSIRRALFNLEKQGKIVQRGFCPGPKGKPVGKYIAFTGKLF